MRRRHVCPDCKRVCDNLGEHARRYWFGHRKAKKAARRQPTIRQANRGKKTQLDGWANQPPPRRAAAARTAAQATTAGHRPGRPVSRRYARQIAAMDPNWRRT